MIIFSLTTQFDSDDLETTLHATQRDAKNALKLYLLDSFEYNGNLEYTEIQDFMEAKGESFFYHIESHDIEGLLNDGK